MPDTRYKITDARCQIQDARYKMPDARLKLKGIVFLMMQRSCCQLKTKVHVSSFANCQLPIAYCLLKLLTVKDNSGSRCFIQLNSREQWERRLYLFPDPDGNIFCSRIFKSLYIIDKLMI